MIKCVAFDMDDTLYDEVDYYRSGFTYISHIIASDYDISPGGVFELLWSIFSDGNSKMTFNAALDELKLSYNADYILKLVSEIRCHKPDISLPSDSKKVLDNLKASYKLALITDGFLPAQQLKVSALGIADYFDSIVYTEKLGREFWKPSAVGFEKVLSDLALLARQCVYVADNLAKDFIAPNKLGFKTIQVVRKNRIHFETAESDVSKAQYQVDSIEKIPELIKGF